MIGFVVTGIYKNSRSRFLFPLLLMNFDFNALAKLRYRNSSYYLHQKRCQKIAPKTFTSFMDDAVSLVNVNSDDFAYQMVASFYFFFAEFNIDALR